MWCQLGARQQHLPRTLPLEGPAGGSGLCPGAGEPRRRVLRKVSGRGPSSASGSPFPRHPYSHAQGSRPLPPTETAGAGVGAWGRVCSGRRPAVSAWSLDVLEQTSRGQLRGQKADRTLCLLWRYSAAPTPTQELSDPPPGQLGPTQNSQPVLRPWLAPGTSAAVSCLQRLPDRPHCACKLPNPRLHTTAGGAVVSAARPGPSLGTAPGGTSASTLLRTHHMRVHVQASYIAGSQEWGSERLRGGEELGICL